MAIRKNKYSQHEKISYKIENDVPYGGVSHFRSDNAEFGYMKALKVGQSFVFPDNRKYLVYRARTYFHKHQSDQYYFATAPATDKEGMRIPGFSRCWRLDISKRRKPRKGKINPNNQ